MNALTRQIIEETIGRHKRIAKENGDDFAYLIQTHYWDFIIGIYGEPLKARAERLFIALRPDFADPDEPTRLSDDWYGTEIDERLSDIVMGIIDRMVDREPELQLTTWGDYPAEYLKPKITDLPLFATMGGTNP